jgi:ATPase subunit of ABC transporter with duplicated ATPase domains
VPGEEVYNANLALRLGAENPEQGLEQVIVRNDICMGTKGRALVLTGPNLGGKTIYLHELAERTEALNSGTLGDSKVVSLLAFPIEEGQLSEASLEEGGQVQCSSRVEAHPPMGRSDARQIAARYGIANDQLERMLIERGVLE